MSGKRTTHPPVPKELKGLVAYLRDTDGCTFEVRGQRVLVYAPGSTRAVHVFVRGKGSDEAPRDHVGALQRHGLAATYREHVKAAPEPAAQAAAPPKRNSPPPPVSPLPARLAAAAHAAPAAAAAVAPTPEEVPMAPAPDPAPDPVHTGTQPVRPHTAHQYRLDEVRRRVLRCLLELGGNTSEVRRVFIDHALETAKARGLPLPIEGKMGGTSTMHESLRSSLSNYLAGKGQVQRNLDIWEAACHALEAPGTPAGGTPLVAVPDVGVGIQVFEDEAIGDAGGPGSRSLYRSSRPAGYAPPTSTADAAPVDDAVQASEAVDAVRAADTGLDAVRASYLQALADKAAAGDADARDRLERYLGLG